MRLHNFAAGPSSLPKTVLEEARTALVDWNGTGLSIMELPFTGPEFKSIQEEAEATLAELLDLPGNYRVLFLQGGAYAMFSLIPMNLLHGRATADYVITGHWSRRAADEGSRYCRVGIAADASANGYAGIPPPEEWALDPAAAYCHITTNETANGVQFRRLPDTGNVPLLADATSDFLTRPIDMSRLGVLYASAQKNIGPAGLTIALIREDLLGRALPITPAVFDFGRQATAGCGVNTPPTWAVYVAGLVFKWLRAEGGLPEMARRNERKARILYDVIDAGDFYACPVELEARSTVNVCFRLPDTVLEERFLMEASASGYLNLKGHSAIGGVRVSLYNAVQEEAVLELARFMERFAATRGMGARGRQAGLGRAGP